MCSMGIVISNKTRNENIEFTGDGWLRVGCNISEEHPKEGEHAFKCNEFEVRWIVLPGGVWMAQHD